jgi:hypothetical protein
MTYFRVMLLDDDGTRYFFSECHWFYETAFAQAKEQRDKLKMTIQICEYDFISEEPINTSEVRYDTQG